MFKRLATVAFTLLFCVVAMAQPKNHSIKLNLVEEGAGTPIEFATVSITPDGAKEPSKYALTDDKGTVSIDKLRDGKYLVRAELMGYETFEKDVVVEGKDVELGKVEMKVSMNFLQQAVITDVGNPIIIKKDTVEYNASSFKITDNDMLEDLLKKLPGIEVGSDGSITANGKTIKKITIDGKTFFLDDPTLASKNIPAKLVNKVKVLEKKSKQAEFTGIDDGEEETIIDLSVMKGMMNGWFGNIAAGGGYDWQDIDDEISIEDESNFWDHARFQTSALVANFTEDQQISFIGNANNTNNRGFQDMAGSMMGDARGGRGMGMGGGGGFGGSGSGITTSYMAGLNYARTWEEDQELAGNYMFSGNENYLDQTTRKQTLKQDGSKLWSDEKGGSSTNSYNHRVGVHADWAFNDNTSIYFEPQFSFGSGNFTETNNFASDNESATGERSKVNDGYSRNTGDNSSMSARGEFLLRQKLGKPGRTISLSANYNYSTNTLEGFNNSKTVTYMNNVANENPQIVDQWYQTLSDNSRINTRLTYTEPLGNRFFLSANYSFNYSQNTSNKNTFDKDAAGQYKVKDEKYSNEILNKQRSQRIGLDLQKQGDKYNLTIGGTVQPTHTYNLTNGHEYTRDVINIAPNARFDYDFSDYASLRILYRGNTNQPSMTQLQPVEDNSNPLAITRGNPNLSPSFTHRLNSEYRFTDMATFSTVNANIGGTYSPSSIVNASWTNSRGVTYTVPLDNQKPNFGINGRVMFNAPIAKSNFSIMSFTMANYNSSMNYIGKADVIDGDNPDSYLNMANYDENRYQTVSVNENLRGVYRDDIIEITLGGNVRYSNSWYQIKTREINPTWTNSIQGGVNATPGLWTLAADANHTWYVGYSDSYTPNTILNASVSRMFFNNQATIQLKVYDILNQSKNTYRTITDNYIQDVRSNSLGRYVMLTFTWRFGTFQRPGGGHGPMGGPGMGRGRTGGPGMGGGRPPMGGPGMGGMRRF